MPEFLIPTPENDIRLSADDRTKYVAYNVANDKDCLFTSIGFLLCANGLRDTLDGTTARLIRNETVQALQDLRNKESTRAAYDTLAVQRTIREAYEEGWGDYTAIRALAERYGCTIKVWKLIKPGTNWQARLQLEAKATSDYCTKDCGLEKSDVVLHLRQCTDDIERRQFMPILPEDTENPDTAAEPVESSTASLFVMSQAKEATKARKLHQVRRTVWGADPYNTLDSLIPLPLVDNHSHLGGKSMGGAGFAGKLSAGRVVMKGGIGSFLYYNTSAEEVLVKKLVNSMKHFCEEKELVENVAACAMVLDFGYVPMRLGAMGTAKKHTRTSEKDKAKKGGLLTRASHTRDEPVYYAAPTDTNPEKPAWFPRSRVAFEEALEKIATSAKVFPGMIWPFIGFDPRRPDGLDIVKKFVPDKGYIGVKLYSRTGWMPIHNRKLYSQVLGDPLDARLDALYSYLVEKDMPVLVHTSPTGFPPDAMGPLGGQDDIAPDKNVLILPWPLTNKRLVPGNNHSCPTGAAPHGYGAITVPLFPPTYSDADLNHMTPGWGLPDRLADTRARVIKKFASYFAHYCLYNQLTTSPYSWEPVLVKHPRLRLCMAHFGADIGAYATVSNNIPVVAKWQDGLERHPYVAGTKKNPGGHFPTPAHEQKSFKFLFKKGLIRAIRKSAPLSNMHDQMEADITGGFFENDPAWNRWFQDWEQAYPLTWPEKILELIGNDAYPNLYTDIAYVTTDPALFPHAIVPLVNKAWNDTTRDGKALKKKLLIGTDWFMTEMQSCSPRDFWNMAWNTFQEVRRSKMDQEGFETNTQILWRLWSSENTLRWIKLEPRMKKLETFYGNTVPPWWETLREHYTSGKADRIPDYVGGVPPPPPPDDDGPPPPPPDDDDPPPPPPADDDPPPPPPEEEADEVIDGVLGEAIEGEGARL